MKRGFSRFLGSRPDRLHFAAHSHHPWPDVSYEAHQQAWLDAAELMDDKWEVVFGRLMPSLRRRIGDLLGIEGTDTLVFAPNTHELLVRLFSCIEPPVRVLSTDAEFHSFTRQSRRWEEEGLAIVDRVPTMPYDSFVERFTKELRAGVHDLVYLSTVFYDSGYVVDAVDRLVSAVSEQTSLVVLDGYHAFMAMPVDLGAIQDRVFFIAGGYKYAMSGEGVCFMHCPAGYGPRPVDTGWYAGFGQLETGVGDSVVYAGDGSRFAGATFDPTGLYRMEAVLSWLESQGITPQVISDHVKDLQHRFLDSDVAPGVLHPPQPLRRGNFLTFETPDAPRIYQSLHDAGVITDHRRDRLRIGFGIYHDSDDVDRLLDVLGAVV
ncbi:MAG: aminotransferase class V-fold PLP-dependent enzyme [Actinobacteria bacterium]|nr:aminotransferase class V-fold PLP-dependent enzyme [Actinomycetota bacterium]MCI0544514.1 aminotransferase class V-fold PLP-dependent enzyme [Actinomycetota bacterium]MCI0679536.1 aminotransferase class V-fold PLP-dependent enzyme [Actinomycetota bacterium]